MSFSLGFGRSFISKVASIVTVVTVVAVAPATALANMSFTSTSFNGNNDVTVVANGTVTVSLSVNLTGGDDWRSTGYRIADELNFNGFGGPSYTCVNTPDHETSNGNHSYTEVFNITAPGTPDIYDVQFKAYDQGGCTGSPSVFVHKNNAMTVTTPVDLCPNVAGNQSESPCADTICVEQGGTWNGSSCDMPDVCPLVDGVQTSGPCANDTCTQSGGLWSANTCVPDACANVTGHQAAGPCADTICVEQGGTWNGNSCDLPVDVCLLVDGLQTESPCANDTCTEQGGLWGENQCVPDVCPNVTGHQSAEPCANITCTEAGGTWTNNECDMPTPEETCLAAGDFWNGESCEEIASCNVETQTYNAETNTCVDIIVTPECEDNQTLVDNECVYDEITLPTGENNDNGGGSGGGSSAPASNGPVAGSFVTGQVLGVSITIPSGNGTSTDSGNGSVLGASCSPLITKFLKMGAQNDPEQVKALQMFLNKELGLSLKVNGEFDAATLDAVKQFQSKYASEILTPWGLKGDQPTGYVYKTTSRWINMLSCTGTQIPMPELS